MQTFKPNVAELPSLAEAARLLKSANASLAAAKKSAEAAKATIEKWLKEERKCDIGTLKIGELVNVEGVALIEVGKMNKFDEKAFLLAQPEQHAAFKKDFAKVTWKPLV